MFTISKQRPSKYFDIEAERTPEGQNLRSRQNEDPKTRLDNLAKEYR